MRFLSYLVLTLGFALGGPVAAQQAADTTALPADAPTVATDTATALDAAESEIETVPPSSALPAVAPPEAGAEQPEPTPPPAQPSQQPIEQVAEQAAEQPDSPPADEQPLPPPAVDRGVADSLAAELAALRAAVLGLAAQRDSLVRALEARPARTDTTARERAQETVERAQDEVREVLQNFVPNLIISLLLIVFVLYVVRGFEWLLEALAARSAERRLFYKKLIPIVRLLIWAFAVYLIIAAIFRVPPNSLLAAAAAIGVAVGFAAQEVLKNIFGGIVIILDQPFQVGDKIAVGGTYGEVVSIGLRSTRIVTPDDNLVSVPNSQVVADQVANANAGELNLQVVTDLYLPGWIDVALAKRIAYSAAANSRYVYLDKPIVVIVKDEFKETFLVHLKVKAYVLDTRYEFLLMSDVTEAAKAEFIRQGLLTPMPIGVDVDVDVDYDRDDDHGAPERPPNGDTRTESPAHDA